MRQQSNHDCESIEIVTWIYGWIYFGDSKPALRLAHPSSNGQMSCHASFCCSREYLLCLCASGSMASLFFTHIALIDWAACFCLADNFLGAWTQQTHIFSSTPSTSSQLPEHTKHAFALEHRICSCLNTTLGVFKEVRKVGPEIVMDLVSHNHNKVWILP